MDPGDFSRHKKKSTIEPNGGRDFSDFGHFKKFQNNKKCIYPRFQKKCYYGPFRGKTDQNPSFSTFYLTSLYLWIWEIASTITFTPNLLSNNIVTQPYHHIEIIFDYILFWFLSQDLAYSFDIYPHL